MLTKPDPAIRAVIASYLPQPREIDPPDDHAPMPDSYPDSADGEPVFEPAKNRACGRSTSGDPAFRYVRRFAMARRADRAQAVDRT